MILPDSNIWIYNFDDDLDPEHGLVEPWLEEWMGKSEILVPAIVETEVLHYLARQLKPGPATTAVRRFMAHPGEVVPLDPAVNRRAGELLLTQGDRRIGGRDAAILVAAKRYNATVVTHDGPMFQVAMDWGLDAHDPVAEAGQEGS